MRSLSVAAGGMVGTLARWGVGAWLPWSPPQFPWGTLMVNVSGAFALGTLGVILIERAVASAGLRAFLTIGLLGSYTTFSTMALEGVRLIEEHRPATALTYWIVTLTLGQVAGVMGMGLGRGRLLMRKETT